MLYGLCALTPPEARRLSVSEAIALVVARQEWHPVLMVARAFREKKEKGTSIEELLERHEARLMRQRARRGEA